jgi:NitT/TauT family transport system substrate-binding protein
MADVTVAAAITLAARGGAEFKGVASANTRFPYLIAARDAVRSVADLSGVSFGIGRVGSLDHLLTMEVLRARRLDPATLKLVSIGQPGLRLVALSGGRIAATTVSVGTWATLPAKAGLHVLVSEQEFASAVPLVGKVLVVPNRILATRRPEMTAVAAALIRASRDFASHPSLWIAAMSKARSDVGEADLRRLADTLRQHWSLNGGLNRNDLAFTSDWLYRTPDFAALPRVPIDAWIDFSVVDAALAELGVDGRGDPPAR